MGLGVKGVVGNELCKSGLDPHASTCSSRTGGDQVTGLATIAAKTSIRSATAFLEGEWTSGTSGSIQVHRDMVRRRRGGRGKTEGRGRRLMRLRGKRRARWLLGSGEDRCSLILLHRNGCTHVVRNGLNAVRWN